MLLKPNAMLKALARQLAGASVLSRDLDMSARQAAMREVSR